MTTQTLTLADFLLARIAEDEMALTLLSSAPPKWTMTVWPHDGEPIPVDGSVCSPAHILSLCATQRRIVERCTGVDFAMPSTHLAQGILAELALPYADHPDYRDEWRA